MNVITPKRKARLEPEYLEWEDERAVVRVRYAEITGAAYVPGPVEAVVEVALAERAPITMAFPAAHAWTAEKLAARLAELAGSGEPGPYYERVKYTPRYAGLTFDAWFGIALGVALTVHAAAAVVRGMPLLIGFAVPGLAFWFVLRALVRWDLDGRAVQRFDRTQPGYRPGPPAGWALAAFYAIEVLVGACALVMLPAVALYWG